MGRPSCGKTRVLLAAAALLVGPMAEDRAEAQAGRAAVSVLKRWGRSHAGELAQEGAERSAARIERLLARHGDDLVPVLRQVGPKGARLLDDLPADAAPLFRRYGRQAVVVFEHHGDEALRLVRAHGDEAIAVLARHPGAGPRLLETFGGPAAPTLAGLSSESAIRLAKMSGSYAKLSPEARRAFLDQLARGGDDFVTWVWKRRVELFGSASMAVGALTLYKVGDGVASVVPELIPRPAAPPDPSTQPVAAWFDRWGLPALLGLAVFAFGALALRRRTVGKVHRCRSTRKPSVTRSDPGR